MKKAKEYGFLVVMNYIGLENFDISKERVRFRVSKVISILTAGTFKVLFSPDDVGKVIDKVYSIIRPPILIKVMILSIN